MNPTDLLVQSAKLVTQVEEQAAAVVTAIAFFMGSMRTVFTLYRKDRKSVV